MYARIACYPLPHRQYVFSLPIMLRVYFRNNRRLLKQLCKIANECLLEFLRQVTHKPDGQLGMVMTIHTFGEYMGFNCHLHALVADGLFSPSGMFYVAPKVSTKPLEQMFRVRVIKMLVEEELLAEELARKLLSWKHSGFSVHNGKPIKRNDTAGLKRVAQYIIRNPFSEQKMTYNEDNGLLHNERHRRKQTGLRVFERRAHDSCRLALDGCDTHPSRGSSLGKRRDGRIDRGTRRLQYIR
ncbi:MAG: transposase [Phycisphaerae bacterium]|nr:transposase [Phycisphaerae bacterium]